MRRDVTRQAGREGPGRRGAIVVLDEWRQVGVLTVGEGRPTMNGTCDNELEKPPEAQWVDQEICGRIAPELRVNATVTSALYLPVCVLVSLVVVGLCLRRCPRRARSRWLRGARLVSQ